MAENCSTSISRELERFTIGNGGAGQHLVDMAELVREKTLLDGIGYREALLDGRVGNELDVEFRISS